MIEERCIGCDNLTGRAGEDEDSLYVDGFGPLCRDCWLSVSKYQKHMEKKEKEEE